MSSTTHTVQSGVKVRAMTEADLETSRSIFRLAFGTFLGVPNPAEFWADREYIYTRWRANPDAALIAELDGSIAGSNFLTRWGSFGFFGPLTVRPDLWDRRIGQSLLGPTMDLFQSSGVRDMGLFTFGQSTKHVGLYQKFRFWPRFLTAVMSKSVTNGRASFLRYSDLDEAARTEARKACSRLTDSIFEGLDPTDEVRSVSEQGLGDTILLSDGDQLDAFAVCHCGRDTEAGENTCYVKFAAVRPGANAATIFERLLDACESFAESRGLSRLECGVNTGRSDAYRRMLQHGFRADMQGVAMQRPDAPCFNRPDVYVMDDWR